MKKTLDRLPRSVLKKKLASHSRYTVGISIVDPKTMRRLNASYRKKKYATDVLSFSHLESMQPKLPKNEIGDVIICWSICQDQAKQNGISVNEELARLAVHGILHLFGYDHEKSASEAVRMFRLQDKILTQLVL